MSRAHLPKPRRAKGSEILMLSTTLPRSPCLEKIAVSQVLETLKRTQTLLSVPSKTLGLMSRWTKYQSAQPSPATPLNRPKECAFQKLSHSKTISSLLLPLTPCVLRRRYPANRSWGSRCQIPLKRWWVLVASSPLLNGMRVRSTCSPRLVAISAARRITSTLQKCPMHSLPGQLAQANQLLFTRSSPPSSIETAQTKRALS